MQEKINEIVAKEGFIDKLLACEEPEQVQKLFAAEGVELSLDEVKALGHSFAMLSADDDELDEDSLDAVAGGSATAIVGAIIGAVQTIGNLPWRRIGRAIRRFFRSW